MNIRASHITHSQKTFRLTPEDYLVYVLKPNPLSGIFLSFLFTFILNCFVISESAAQVTLVAGSPTTSTTNSTTLIINKPAGLSVNDIMIVNIAQSDDDLNNGGDLSNASAAGWTLIDGRQTGVTGTGGDEWWQTVLFKIATAADVSATTFSFTVDGDADESEGAIIAFSNVDVTGGVTQTGAAGALSMSIQVSLM